MSLSDGNIDPTDRPGDDLDGQRRDRPEPPEPEHLRPGVVLHPARRRSSCPTPTSTNPVNIFLDPNVAEQPRRDHRQRPAIHVEPGPGVRRDQRAVGLRQRGQRPGVRRDPGLGELRQADPGATATDRRQRRLQAHRQQLLHRRGDLHRRLPGDRPVGDEGEPGHLRVRRQRPAAGADERGARPGAATPGRSTATRTRPTTTRPRRHEPAPRRSSTSRASRRRSTPRRRRSSCSAPPRSTAWSARSRSSTR